MCLQEKSRGCMALSNTWYLFFFIFLFELAYSCAYHYSSSAFLFSLVNKPGWAPVKLSQTGVYGSYNSYSMYSCYDRGPTFSNGHDIYIASYASSNTNSYTYLGYTYSPPSGHSHGSSFTKSFLAGSYYFQPDEVEVYYETTWNKHVESSVIISIKNCHDLKLKRVN